MKPPKTLGAAGSDLWITIHAGLLDLWELDEREAAVLALACRQADVVADLETAVKSDGVMVKGSTGQPTVNPAIVEARQGRLAIDRMLGKIVLPQPEKAGGEPPASELGPP